KQTSPMPHIAIISASVRTGRMSHRVALFFKKFIEAKKLATTEILDLNEYQFPVFSERLRNQLKPSAQVLDFAEKIKKADGVLIVTPEYNGGYPADG
ncbi:MAG TPA: NAD(P)H-dependent oxidoreductase, partial [Saprospiraceae bacterium]|nr:NAD(P)H-dependent oxidoreductase [Saprospiraceae bacterium]